MSDLRTAAQQALEAWQDQQGMKLLCEAMDALGAALELPYAEQARRVEQETHGRMRIDPVTGDVSIGTPTEQEQEPVAWMDPNSGEVCRAHWLESHAPERDVDRFSCPLYTHPPRREPLSVEELDRLWREPMSADWEHREYARAIEAAHGIKENT
jgi:hypothetical protein